MFEKLRKDERVVEVLGSRRLGALSLVRPRGDLARPCTFSVEREAEFEIIVQIKKRSRSKRVYN